MIMKFLSALILINVLFGITERFGAYAKTLLGYFPEGRKNDSFPIKNDVSSLGSELYIGTKVEPIIESEPKRNTIESNVIEMIQKKFYDLADHPRRRIDDDDPNQKQWLMAHAFIDSLNDVFRRQRINEDRFGGYGNAKLNRNPFNDRKKIGKVWNRVDLASLVDNDDLDEKGPRGGFRMSDLKPPRDTSVHCVRSGPNTIICSHDNFTYALSLPESMIRQETVENLVSSICTIVESGNAGDTGKGGVVSLTVSNEQTASGLAATSFLAASESPKRIIKINIPIDLETIPTSLSEGTVPSVQAEVSFLTDEGRMKPRAKRKVIPLSSPLFDFRLSDLPRLYRRVSYIDATKNKSKQQQTPEKETFTKLTFNPRPPLNI